MNVLFFILILIVKNTSFFLRYNNFKLNNKNIISKNNEEDYFALFIKHSKERNKVKQKENLYKYLNSLENRKNK